MFGFTGADTAKTVVRMEKYMTGVLAVETERPAPPETPPFFNELGVSSIQIGVTAFHCMGAMPPHDHPHIYLNMGAESDILCSYCSTEFRFNAALSWNETIPANCSAHG